MFSLFYGLWKYLFTKTEYHVLILGIDKAGKSTFLEKLKSIYLNTESLPPDRIVPTVGLNIGRIEVSNTKLVFWDLGGQPGLRSIWEKYYEEAHAVVFVIDAASPSRFEDSKSSLEKVLRNEDLQGAPLLILANNRILLKLYQLMNWLGTWILRSWMRGFTCLKLSQHMMGWELKKV
ncbi:hypothetical protein EUGRSUZ_A02800 [Eucalyptus grandis]|uniref:ADP-ribosylation factor-related protein 1 n=2 Tax=Eucalyptus grandis TaxID=71139 RepID=A0A059DIV4_EUCGR|nr:hypothetical protein EUGRSUZ_A02800 [Eucalyptus grandis]